jgi:hypothetical protein
VMAFRELLQAHQDYWLQVMDTNKQKIPDLEVYIVNDHPPKGSYIKDDDLDGTKDRINDKLIPIEILIMMKM